MKDEYEVSERTEYCIWCVSCNAGTLTSENVAEVIEHAKSLGFHAEHTPEDGTINFCARCYASVSEAK